MENDELDINDLIIDDFSFIQKEVEEKKISEHKD